MRKSNRTGFTLVELLIVTVIIALLASIAMMTYGKFSGRARAAAMRSDLRNLASAQESYLATNFQYTMNVGLLEFNPTSGVALTMSEASTGGWSATSTHPAAQPLVCAIFYGTAAPLPPATHEGRINCQ
jgi:type IV pilus assembly protein PilA